MSEKTRRITAFIMLSVVLIVLVGMFMIPSKSKNDVISLEIGKSYVRSHTWDEKNPYQKADIDTIQILDKKDGYVKFSLNSSLDTSFYHSGEEEFLIEFYKVRLVK